MRDCMVEKGGDPFSWAVQAGYKRVGYLDCCGCWETYESLRADWLTQLHSRTVLVDSQPWLEGDTDVGIQSSGVYGWVEHPWSAVSQCRLS